MHFISHVMSIIGFGPAIRKAFSNVHGTGEMKLTILLIEASSFAWLKMYLIFPLVYCLAYKEMHAPLAISKLSG